MIIHHDTEKRNTLMRTHKGPHCSRYSMTIAGWYAGTISAKSDTEALNLFKAIIESEESA